MRIRFGLLCAIGMSLSGSPTLAADPEACALDIFNCSQVLATGLDLAQAIAIVLAGQGG